MILITSNPRQQLLCVSYLGEVVPPDLAQSRQDIRLLLAAMKPGFTLLADLSHLKFMGLDCAEEIGRNMELLDQAGVGTVVRVIPDPSKDIGMKILSLFHYSNHPRFVTHDNLAEAARALII